MQWIKKYSLFKESVNTKSSNDTIIELCIGMLLINNSFLDNLLDKNLKARYTENNEVFVNDIKMLLMGNNRLKVGVLGEDGKFTEDTEVSKILPFFNDLTFDINKKWNSLIDARNTSRNIIDKLLPNDKLTPEMIKNLYWIAPNKNDNVTEDLVIETENGNQYSLYLNSNLTNSKSIAFNTFTETIIDNTEFNAELYNEENIQKWNKLTQEWVRLVYDYGTNETKAMVEKFLDGDRIYSVGYYDYFKITIKNDSYKILGEFFPLLNKNIKDFDVLINEIYKNIDKCIKEPSAFMLEWNDIKNTILFSKLLEHTIDTYFTKLNNDTPLERLNNNYYVASNTVKMNMMKFIVEQLNSSERESYYLSNNGNVFLNIPKRDFFRKNYDDFDISCYFHKSLINTTEDSTMPFNIKLKYKGKKLLSLNSSINFTKEISSRLTCKFKLNVSEDFNNVISDYIAEQY
jgi:hypothetical protein